MTTHQERTNKTKGIVFMLLSALGFALMATFVKLSGDLPFIQKAFFRNSIALTVAIGMIIKTKGVFFGKKASQKGLLLRSALGTCGIFCHYYAIDRLLLPDASMLNKLSPFFVILFSYFFLKESIAKKQLLAVLVAFIGALFIIKPSFNMTFLPGFIGLLGGLFAGAAYTMLRYLGPKESPKTIVFYFAFFSTLVTLPLMLLNFSPMTPLQLFYLVLAGCFASLGQFSITWAYKCAPASEIAMYDYSNILFAALISFFVFDVLPDVYSLLGYGIIIITALFLLQKKKL